MGDADLTEYAALLERTPRVLTKLLAGLPAPWLEGTDTPGGWRARDVVGHLISAEIDDWIPRIELIVSYGPDRPFDPFDRFAHVERDRDVSLVALLERFADLRAANLARLAELVTDEADLERVGTHPSLGHVTMRQLLATWAVHDLDHVAQAYAALSASQDEAVGPWKAYLGILLRRDDPSAAPG
jgi:DinB superfamily